MIKILFLAANPIDTDRLRLDEEVRAIDEALRKAEFRDQFELYQHWAVRIEDLQELLLRRKPDIVHFSGHGTGLASVAQRVLPTPPPTRTERNLELVLSEAEMASRPASPLVLQDASGKSAPVPLDALSNLFRVLKDNIRCVVLNACYSQAQAERIAQHIDCVIGMSDAIPDMTAIAFATAFYRGLGYGRSIQLAFDLGRSQIDLSALHGSAIPQLMALRVGAEQLVLAIDGALPAAITNEPAPGEPPYQGLQFFDVKDAAFFFGRERLTAKLVADLRTQPFLAVIGASGSGKSSLVRAGLVPALQRGGSLVEGVLPPTGSAQWPVHIITPKAHPLKELAVTLTHERGSDLAQLRLMDELAQDARVLDACASRLLSGSVANRLLLVVDQFEELFTLCRDPGERQAFIDNLLTAAVDDGVVTVVITLRADFYAHCAGFPQLRLALATHQEYIGPMRRDELRRAIEEPARLGGWEFEAGLVDLLLYDVGDEPGALPLLSHSLLETWKRRRGRLLTLAGYVASGRVQGAIAQTAERVFTQQLTPEQQTLAKKLFLQLTEVGEGAEDTRRRVALTELVPTTERNTTSAVVLKTLADARLITIDKEEVEVAHEALIRQWPTLRRWLDENREGLRIHRRLTEAAQEWQTLQRDPGALYRGVRLLQVLEWEGNNAVEFLPIAQAFLDASKAVAARQRRQRRWAIGTAVLLVFMVVGGLSGWLFIVQWNQATYVQLRHEAMLARDALHPETAIQKLTAANAIFPDQFDLNVEVDNVRRYVATAWLTETAQLKAELQPVPAIAKLKAIHDLDPTLLDLDAEIADVRRDVATAWVQAGEQLAKAGDYKGAGAKFSAALELAPPPDTSVYVWIAPGEFAMGSTGELSLDDERPAHMVFVDGFWIGRTEVTNAQYLRCVEAKICEPLSNIRYTAPELANHPATSVSWSQAKAYAAWVGGRLPTEAEWEKACRGTDGRLYPWGNEEPTAARANIDYTVSTTTPVGSYPAGANDLYDMAGNVMEWTNSAYRTYPYNAADGREQETVDASRTMRGGSWSHFATSARCAIRAESEPYYNYEMFGLRVVLSPHGF